MKFPDRTSGMSSNKTQPQRQRLFFFTLASRITKYSLQVNLDKPFKVVVLEIAVVDLCDIIITDFPVILCSFVLHVGHLKMDC